MCLLYRCSSSPYTPGARIARELVEMKDDEASYFELAVRSIFNLYQQMVQVDQIELLEFESKRNEMRKFAMNLMSYYKE